jgi:hypothetical protein
MSFLSRISDMLFGARGPAEVVVTRTENSVSFRLPGQHPSWGAQGAVFVLMTILGAFGVFLIVNGFWRFGADGVANWCGGPTVILFVSAMIVLAVRMRISWRYEIELTPGELRVHYVTTPQRACVARIDLTPIRQLTVVRKGLKSLLQAEGVDGSVRLIIRQQDHDALVRLANLLAAERDLHVAIEDPRSIQADRVAAPVSSKIALTRHDTGITFDFPLPADPRERARTRAWVLFEIGILSLISTIIVYVFFQVYNFETGVIFLVVPFVGGLIALASASGQSWKAWLDHTSDADMRQLSVAGNMLIRTSRDHRKQVWYREEIRFVGMVERSYESNSSGEGGSYVTIMRAFQLVVESNDGQSAILHGIDAEAAQADYRPKAELEWIATEIRRALFNEPGEPNFAPPEEIAHAIQVTDERISK